MNTEKDIEKMAKRMRLQALDMAYHAGKTGSHLGGGFSCIEILAALYGGSAKLDAQRPTWKYRDRILISKAHAVLAYYTALYEAGFLTKDDLNSFEQDGSDFVGHPLRNMEKGIEYAGGSLGMALSVGCGIALDLKNRNIDSKVFVLLGDGECQEGSVWEAMMFAAKEKLDNLVMIIDNNKLQYDGTCEEIGGLYNIPEKCRAFGWYTINCNGHRISELMEAFSTKMSERPLAIVADTVKGKGVSFMENNPLWHHSELKQAQYEEAKAEIEKGEF